MVHLNKTAHMATGAPSAKVIAATIGGLIGPWILYAVEYVIYTVPQSLDGGDALAASLLASVLAFITGYAKRPNPNDKVVVETYVEHDDGNSLRHP